MYVKGDKRETVTPIQFYIDKDIYIKDSDRVLAVSAIAEVTGCEALQGEMRVNYRVTYKVIYMSDGAYRVQEESGDYTAQIKSASITPKSYVDADASVISCEHVGDSNVKIRTMLEIRGFAVVESGFDVAEPSDDHYVRYNTVEVQTITPVNYAETVAEGTASLRENVSEILTTDTDVCVKNVSIATDMCEISGECLTYATYVADGMIGGTFVSYPFLLEVPTPGIKQGDDPRFTVSVKSTGASVTETDGGAEITLETIVSARGVYASRSEIEIPTDVYSKTRDLKPVTNTSIIESGVCLGRGSDRFGSSFTPEDGKGCAKILCVCPPFIGARNVTVSDGTAVEGLICAEIVYTDLDDEIKRMFAEIPYRAVIDGDFDCSGNLEANAVVTEIGAKVRRANEIEVHGSVFVEVFGTDEREVEYISDIKDAGEIIPDDAVISLYIVGKGETLYDVAKALRSDEEELVAMNPEIELPVKEGDKVMYYRI